MPNSSVFEPLLASLPGSQGDVRYISLERAEALGICKASRLPLTLKILLESALRHAESLSNLNVAALARVPRRANLEFRPSRLLLQDFTGVPLMTDLASLRDEVAARGIDPLRVNPRIPIDFVCDHALIAEYGGRPDAMALNERIEIERNRERFAFLKWCSEAFSNIRLIPPGSGIMHQLNLEWLSSVVWLEDMGDWKLARPDTLLGTDSHTPMVGGLGILGWGVGGIEAQAAMLGQSTLLTAPRVVGMCLSGVQQKGITATDIVLHVAQFLRNAGVVNSFVEVFGEGVRGLPIETRATISNMAPEYGATSVYFPIDDASLRYLRLTGRDEALIGRVENYAKAQGLWQGPADGGAIYDETLEFDLSAVVPALAGPKRPEQKTPLPKVPESFKKAFSETRPASSKATLKDGDIVIAAITSCTNTANPSVMLGAGLLARNAVRRGLTVKPWVKTSLAPGSRVVGDYLTASHLQTYLDRLGFQIIGYGCTTCNGNSGALTDEITRQIVDDGVSAVAVLSGNRNFAGRIHPLVPASYLASPGLVVAYAMTGTVLVDLSREPLGIGSDGSPVMLADIWPSDEEISALLSVVSADKYRKAYRDDPQGHAGWSQISAAKGVQFPWVRDSTFITPSPLDIPSVLQDEEDSIVGLRALAVLGDGVTTDTLSPNGEILSGTPAAHFLADRGISPANFGNYAARRGSHEIAVRGMFANPHIDNEMLPGKRGPHTLLMPECTDATIFDAGMAYVARGVPAIIIAGKGYGSGSSRDWAAKGVRHLGVQVVLAESFERIHRANLIGVGILPLIFGAGTSRKTLVLTGREQFHLRGLRAGLHVAGKLMLDIVRENSDVEAVPVFLCVETENEIQVLRTGGLLPVLLEEFAKAG